MTKNLIKMGKTEAGKNLQLDLELFHYSSPHLLVAGTSGAGKSTLVRMLVERTVKAQQSHVIIIDPEGEHKVLREILDLVLIGPNGDQPATVKTAALAGKKFMEHSINGIIDLSELSLDEKREYTRLFVEAVMRTKEANWHPTMIIFDEAQIFAPNNSVKRDGSDSTDALRDLVARGRKRGFVAVFATTRITLMHNDVSNTNNLLLGMFNKPIDRKRAGEILGLERQDYNSLQILEPGQFYAQGRAFMLKGTELANLDKPESRDLRGAERAKYIPPTPKKIQATLTMLGDLPDEVQAEVDKILRLEGEVNDLRRQLRLAEAEKKQPQVVVQKEVEEVIVERTIVDQKSLDDLVVAATRFATDMQTMSATAQQQFSATIERIKAQAAQIAAVEAKVVRPIKAQSTPRPAPVAQAQPTANDGKMGGAHVRVLTALAQNQGRPLSKKTLAALSGYRIGGHFNNVMGDLRKPGYITTSEPFEITSVGLAALGPYEELPTGKSLLDYWINQLGPSSTGKLLKTLWEVHPTGLSKEQLAELTNYQVGGHFNNMLGDLRVRHLVVDNKQSKTIHLNGDVFDVR